MCKIIVLTNASLLDNFTEFTRMCADAMDMQDGYGHAVQGEKGVFGMRTLNPEFYANSGDYNVPVFCETPHEFFGTEAKITGAAIIHGRVSTNNVSMLNTHPISKDGWHLIHNGVVTDHGPKYEQLTTNDSEHVLHNLMQGIDKVANNLTGYYAVGALDPEGRLHVIKDKVAQLHYAYSVKLQSGIFATTAELFKDIGDYLDETLAPLPVKNDLYLVFQDGQLKTVEPFKSRGYDNYSRGYSMQSLGYDCRSRWEYYSDITDRVTDSYLDEIDHYLDDSYTIMNGLKPVAVEEFKRLPLDIQVECEVRRRDGSLLNPYRVDDTPSVEEIIEMH